MYNLQHLKYAVEVERTGSISKAAKNLFMGQPHLSKAIMELEDSIGIAVFNRSPKGVVPTVRGEEFLRYAKNILAQMDEMEALYRPSESSVRRFDVSVPRSGYIAHAFTELAKKLESEKDVELNYRETNAVSAIGYVADNINSTAVIRFQPQYEKYFMRALDERDLLFKPVWEFDYLLMMSIRHPLARASVIHTPELLQYTEIFHGDVRIPTLPYSEARRLEKADERRKKILVYERGSELELLSRLETAFMWGAPEPSEVLDRFSLVQKECAASKRRFRDVLIYRRGYRFSAEDNLFMELLKESAEEVSKNRLT